MVEGRSTRKYADENGIAQAGEAAGLYVWEHKIKTITALEKQVGRNASLNFSALIFANRQENLLLFQNLTNAQLSTLAHQLISNLFKKTTIPQIKEK